MRVTLKQDARALRRQAYEAEGLSHEALTEALIEGDQAEIARIRAARAAIKKRIPKG